ncbi:hypothetical protein [Micrococcus luteus]|uniref:hypothetical protein n=1 Tax=Micrococcus luteus TaxID=1270 RepID=UPI0033218818
MTRSRPLTDDPTEGPFDIQIADGHIVLLDDCPNCHTGIETPLPVGDALLGAEQLQAAARLAEPDAPADHLPPRPSRHGMRLVNGPNGGA